VVGGKGHAKSHYEETGKAYPLAVKLGTLNAAGGDCYDYGADDACEDPLLASHLAYFAINIMACEKHEASTAELVSARVCFIAPPLLPPSW
jgi:ubiquitin carboxyl-terminal hydrolase 5/13